MSKDIRHLKLVNGEEIISTVLTCDDQFVLEMPLKIHSEISQYGQTFFFTKWQPMAEDTICNVSIYNVITDMQIKDYLKDRYIELCEAMNNQNEPNPFDDYSSEQTLEDLLESIKSDEDGDFTIH